MKRLLQILALAFAPLLILPAFALPAAAQESDVFTAQARNFTLTQGWFQGRETFYYDFGSNSPVTNNGSAVTPAPIYVLITGMDASGNPQMVEGQRNIIDVVPGDPGYSDLWAVTFVTVPANYVANTLKSADDVKSSGYPMAVPGVLVNCPVVPLNSTLAEPVNGSTEPTRGWYKGREVHYFDFGMNTDKTAPIFAFITGFDASGNPQFVEGQHNVIDVIPGQPGYSAFWDVNLVKVPTGYKANTITSREQVMASGFEIVHPGIVVNCPVIRTAETVSAGGGMMPGMPKTGEDGGGWLPWVLIAGAVTLVVGTLLRRREAIRVRSR
jgi:cold shock CspA family protein